MNRICFQKGEQVSSAETELTGNLLRNVAPASRPAEITAGAVRQGIAALGDRWTSKSRFASHRRWITWSADGPELGASTLLARSVAGNEARLIALLSVAFERRVPADVLERLERAEQDFRRGELAESAMHIALANFPPLDDLESCRRLHMATGLLDLGFLDPLALLKISDIETSEVAKLSKYREDQPRVPAGQRDGGEWTREGGETAQSERRKTAPSGDLAIALPEGCHEEWESALSYCARLLASPNPSRALTGGHTTAYGCAKGLVSQRCGGNPV